MFQKKTKIVQEWYIIILNILNKSVYFGRDLDERFQKR